MNTPQQPLFSRAAEHLLQVLPSGTTTEAEALSSLYDFLLVWAKETGAERPAVVARNLAFGYADPDFASDVISEMAYRGFAFSYPSRG